mgnify:CR=1 FL=1
MEYSDGKSCFLLLSIFIDSAAISKSHLLKVGYALYFESRVTELDRLIYLDPDPTVKKNHIRSGFDPLNNPLQDPVAKKNGGSRKH